jgi:hypothetical protein
LGGAGAEAGTPAVPPVQVVALGISLAPAFGGLVSLVTLTQVLPWSSVGEGLEMPSPVELPLEEASDGPQSEPPVQTAVTISRPDALGSYSGMIDATNPAELAVPTQLGEEPVLMPGDPAAPGRITLSRPATAVVSTHDNQSVERVTVTRLMVTGAIAATAFWGRRVIRDLKWRKRVSAGQKRAASPLSRRRPHGSTTVTWSPAAMGHALRHGPGRAVLSAPGPRPSKAR